MFDAILYPWQLILLAVEASILMVRTHLILFTTVSFSILAVIMIVGESFDHVERMDLVEVDEAGDLDR